MNVSYVSLTFSPDRAARRKRSVSRVRLYGSVNSSPFHRSTITSLEVPMPSAKRPGAAWASEPTHWANVAGPRVYTGTMALPRRNDGAHTDARARGVKASAPLASEDHTSV